MKEIFNLRNTHGIAFLSFLILIPSIAFPQCELIINNPDPVCFPATVDLTDPGITKGSEEGLTFSYWTDSIATLTLDGPSDVTATGMYYIKAEGTSGCSAIAPVMVTIEMPLRAGLSGTLMFNEGEETPVSLFDIISGEDRGGVWKEYSANPSGVSLEDPTALDFSMVSAGDYFFSYTHPATGSCPSSESTAEIVILSASGVNNISAPAYINVFPNPTSGIINIKGLFQPAVVSVFSIHGKLLQTEDQKEGLLDISYLPGGVYFLRIKTEEIVLIEKIIKE